MEEKVKKAASAVLRRGLSGAALKWIAVVSMFIDHCAVMAFLTWIVPMRRAAGIYPILSKADRSLYWYLRALGRPAFPIYCFLLAEGLLHTRDVKKYLGRLLAFALISELPFDQALFGGWTWAHQNVYFTLFLGLLAAWGIRTLAGDGFLKKSREERLLRFAACGAVAAAAMNAAELLHTDYGWVGVAVILLFFLLRQEPVPRDCAAGFTLLASSEIEAASWVVFPLFHLYNGKRGRQPKYFFYAFYPGHLALLWLIRSLAMNT